MGSVRTTKGEKPPPTSSQRRNRRWRAVILTVLVLGLIGWLGYAIEIERYAPASGYTTTPSYAEVRASATGKITEILADSGRVVARGDVLLRLEDTTERSAAAEAAGQVSKAEAELAFREAEQEAETRRRDNRIREAELDLRHARARLEVTQQLRAKGLASGRQLSEDEHGVAKGEELLRALKEENDGTVAERQLEVLRRELEARRTALERAEMLLEQRLVRAPIAGRVVRYTFFVGEIARPDMALYEIFDGDVNQLRLRVPERFATRIKPGMDVEAQLGTYRTLIPTHFKGEVQALRDVMESDGTRNFRVAYCSLDNEGVEVAPGTSADARIRIGKAPLWVVLLRP